MARTTGGLAAAIGVAEEAQVEALIARIAPKILRTSTAMQGCIGQIQCRLRKRVPSDRACRGHGARRGFAVANQGLAD